MLRKVSLFVLLSVFCFVVHNVLSTFVDRHLVNESLKQLTEHNYDQVTRNRVIVDFVNAFFLFVWGSIAFQMFFKEITILLNSVKKFVVGFFKPLSLIVLFCSSIFSVGCMKPYEPVQLEVIDTNEFAFLIPLNGETELQSTSTNEVLLKKNMVYTQQVKIPQQWIKTGYEFIGYNGHWQPAAVLIKVDSSPVTREWTADPNSGTSSKNEAIWVMTADQVEFSTGWSITARIANKEDAVKFLYNYPNGSLSKVLDSEVRSKLQTVFGLEVTDLPMDTLRKSATPHILKTAKEVTDFFAQRGITITNLGISGGFVYKDKTIMDTLVKVFNAEQDKNIAAAATATQEEKNKSILLAAQGKADALMREKKAEADAIEMLAQAKAKELELVQKHSNYLELRRLDVEKEAVTKWDGQLPQFYMGSDKPNLLLNPSKLAEKPEKPKDGKQ